MEILDPTVGTEQSAATNGTPPPGTEKTLAELTRCLSDAYTARGRIHLDRGELDLALAGLDGRLEDGAERAARAAPLRPEVDDHGQLV